MPKFKIPDTPDTNPDNLTDIPVSQSQINAQNNQIIGHIQTLIQDGALFYRVLKRYNDSFSLRTRYPWLFRFVVVISLLFDGLYFLGLSLGILATIFLIIYAFAKGIGLFK